MTNVFAGIYILRKGCSMSLNLVPSDDIYVSLQKQILFRVSKRNKKGERWETVKDDIAGLDKAIEITKSMDDEHIAIFIKFETGNRFYWSSDKPNAFNSAQIQDDFYISSYKRLQE
jgi:hypothetical protein